MATNIPNKTALFNPLSGHLEQLFGYIDLGDLGLPDLQRPFVWKNSKVRDLFDSIYRGYPIGSYLLWRNSSLNAKSHQIGTEKKEHLDPNLLIIDGQQRLTALYSVFRDKFVKDESYQDRKIVISFNPVTEEFKVADASTERNLEFINNISDLFTKSSTRTFINNYLSDLKTHGESLKQKREEIIKKILHKAELNQAESFIIIDKIKSKQANSEEEKIIIEKLENEEESEVLTEKECSLIEQVLKEEDIFDEDLISNRIEKLYNLKNYPFNALEIVPNISEEQVAEIFTRINSKGTVLKQADFILTLLSVFWEDGRKKIDTFCKSCLVQPDKKEKESPFNYILEAMPNDIIRTIAGVGFNKGKMKDVYAILTGRDFSTKKVSNELREKQFEIFKNNLEIVLDNTNWHSFLKIIIGLCFKSKDLISSTNNIVNSYIIFLIGKIKYNLDHKELEEIIEKWFFFASLTSRYSFSPESQMESDLNRIKECKNKQDFISALKNIIDNDLTNDFWDITLPNRILVSSSMNNPARNTYFACLIRNGSKVLFSNRTVSDLFDPSMKLRKKALEKHHLFPRNYLKKKLIFDRKQINQIANFTYLEFEDNIDISDDDPKKYFLEIKNKYFTGKEDILYKMMIEHCLPETFYEMEYQEFLKERRILMAKLIRETYEKL
jgi:hypothetical protein